LTVRLWLYEHFPSLLLFTLNLFF